MAWQELCMSAPFRFRATVEYDGTDFAGFQIQPGARTVQGELERALEAVSGVQTRVVGAGRTDRGVHARGQVVAFNVPWRHGLPDLHQALNAVLDRDLSVLILGKAEPDFHPRFSAVGRAYRYRILNRPVRSPLTRRRSWHLPYELDADRMAEASHCLVGVHDFATFGRPPQGENTVRSVTRAEWQVEDTEFRFDIEANAFLYRMVRCIVGMLALVGQGTLSAEAFEAVLLARDRAQIKQVAPPQGLCLQRVDYATREGVLL
jgi:tRNA pseudouridine38-40 synthase